MEVHAETRPFTGQIHQRSPWKEATDGSPAKLLRGQLELHSAGLQQHGDRKPVASQRSRGPRPSNGRSIAVISERSANRQRERGRGCLRLFSGRRPS